MDHKEKLADNIMILPFMFKKLIKHLPSNGLPRPQLGLLFLIKNENKMPMNYYSEKLILPKSNITVIADKLVEEGFVQRAFDSNDRRIITLEITTKGRECLETHKKKMKKLILEGIKELEEKDAERINELFEEMKAIFHKLSN